MERTAIHDKDVARYAVDGQSNNVLISVSGNWSILPVDTGHLGHSWSPVYSKWRQWTAMAVPIHGSSPESCF